MSLDELKNDMQKFADYLQANGITILTGHLTVEHVDGTRATITAGSPDWALWAMATSVIADKGYEVRRKP
jgi:hypothetical protein